MDTRTLRHVVGRAVNALGHLLRRFKRTAPIPARVDRITTLHLDRIGDAFVATPTLAAIAERFPAARITALVAPWNRSVLEGNPAIAEIIVVEPPDVHTASTWDYVAPGFVRKLAGVISLTRADVLVDFQGLPFTILAGWLARTPVRTGDGQKFLSFLFTHPAPTRRGAQQIDGFLEFARALGWSGTPRLPAIFPGDAERAAVDAFVAAHVPGRFVVFHLSAGRSFRQWPLQHFAAVASSILRDFPDVRVVVDGAGGDAPLAGAFAAALGNDPRVILAVGQFSIRASYELYGRAWAFVGNDSAPGHLAAARGIHTATVMNAWTEVSRWKARGPNAEAFYVEQSGHRCAGNDCTLNPCPRMQELSPDIVYAWLRPRLAS